MAMDGSQFYVLDSSPVRSGGGKLARLFSLDGLSIANTKAFSFEWLASLYLNHGLNHGVVFHTSRHRIGHEKTLHAFRYGELSSHRILGGIIHWHIPHIHLEADEIVNTPTFQEMKNDYETYKRIIGDHWPCIILLAHDGIPEQVDRLATLEPLMRSELGVPDHIRAYPCNLKDKASTIPVLRTFISGLNDYPGKADMLRLLEAL
jgi:hypothetical protein